MRLIVPAVYCRRANGSCSDAHVARDARAVRLRDINWTPTTIQSLCSFDNLFTTSDERIHGHLHFAVRYCK